MRLEETPWISLGMCTVLYMSRVRFDVIALWYLCRRV